MATATSERKRTTKASWITLDYGAFKRAVTIAAHAVPSRSTRPVLTNVRIGDGLVTGTDLEYRIDVELDDAAFKPLLLPKDRLIRILRESSADTVTLVPDGTSCQIKIGRGEWRLPTEDAAEFPLWEPSGLHAMPSIPGDEFSRAVKSVIYAIDRNSSRYALGGVLVEAIGSDMHFVATDGRRMSIATCGHDFATDDFVREPKKDGEKAAPIVPIQPLTQLVNECQEDEIVSMQSGGGSFVGNVGGVTVTARTIEGRFPKWNDIIPEKLPPANLIDRQALSSAVKAAGVVTSEASKGVTFTFANGMLTLTARSSEGGESKVECDVAEYETDAVVCLNPTFVDHFLRPFGSDDDPCVKFRVCPKDGRTVLTVNECYTGVIMPLAEEG